MINSRWENEITLLRSEITVLEARVNINYKKEKLLLLQKKAVIQQYQQAIEKMVDKLYRLARSKIPLPPRARAIMHWGHVIAEKTWRLYQRKSAFWDLTMWQTLIRSRLNCGAGPDEMCIDDHDLIDMATRLDLLKQAENRLNARFVALKEQKKQAVEDRKTIKTKLSNIHAAHSLQTSQATGHKLTDNPVYQSLKTYVNWLTLPLRRSTDEERKFHENYKEVIRMTQNTLTYCRNLALANFDEQGVTEPHSQEALTKLKEDLVHIDKLHADMETSIVKIFRKTMPLPNPVIRREIVQR